MTNHRWKQDALQNHPFKLTEKQQTQITESCQWAPLPEVEKICSYYLYWCDFMSGRPKKANALQYLNGDKKRAGYIAKLKKSFEANIDLMKTFDEASPWLTMHRSDPLFTSLKKTNAQLLIAIKRANRQAGNRPTSLSQFPASEQIAKMEKIIANDYPTNRSQKVIAELYLVDALADLYLEVTGYEVTRNNPYGLPGESPLADIVKILDGVLDCGPCTGVIKKVIRTRREISLMNP